MCIGRLRKLVANRLFSLRESYFSRVPPVEFYLLPKFEKNIVFACYLTQRGDPQRSVQLLLENLMHRPNDLRTNEKLTFNMSKYGSKELAEYCLHTIKKLGDFIWQNDLICRSFCELSIFLESPNASTNIDHYLSHFIQRDRTSNNLAKQNKPVLFWHVPKCAGTSLNTFMACHFYNSGLTFFPNYNTPLMLKYLIEQRIGSLPYLSSAHLTEEVLDLEIIRQHYYQVLVVRDPFERALSSWRQYYQNPYHRLQILQQHGSVWDYWPRADLTEWVKRVPPSHINYLSYTFAKDFNIDRAHTYVKSLDLIGNQRDIDSLVKKLCYAYDLEYHEGKIPKKLNSTLKSIKHFDHEADFLKENLKADFMFYERTMNYLQNFDM